MVIATVFLTIIAMTVGYVLSERQRGVDRSSGGGSVNSPTPADSPAPGFTPPGPFCPQFTREQAEKGGFSSELWQLLKVKAEGGSTTWWICTDARKQLFYQSQTGNFAGDPVQNETGLFLPDVSEIGKGSYEVTAPDGNVFRVSSRRFELIFADASKKRQYNDVRPAD